MIVVPAQSGALAIRIVVVRLTRKKWPAGNIVKDTAWPVHKTGAMGPVRRGPSEGPTVADPWHKAPVQVGHGTILRQFSSRHGRIHGQEMLRREGIGEPNARRRPFSVDEHAA